MDGGRLERTKRHEVISLPQKDRGWRWVAVSYISAHWDDTYKAFGGDVYEFGVAGGNSIASIRAAFKTYGLQEPRTWGFDSFAGLPPEQRGISRPTGWSAGTYDSSRTETSAFKCVRTGSGGVSCTGRAQPMTFDEQIERMDSVHGFSRADTNFVQGFYNVSLTDDLPSTLGLRPAMYVDIDCDLYISTFQALDWIFAKGLAKPGTLIGYDDFCLTELGTAGESRAHNEIARKYDVTFECVVGGCSDSMLVPGKKGDYHRMISGKLLNPIFVVRDIGGFADTGMQTYPRKCVTQSKAWDQVTQ